MYPQNPRNTAMLMTTAEVAEHLHMAPRSVTRLVALDLFPRPYRIGSANRWDPVRLQRWLDDGAPTPIPKEHQ